MIPEKKTILHYSSDPVLQYRYKKIKAVVSALKTPNLVEESKELFTNLHEISPIPLLPLLEDTQRNIKIAGSNPIIRYLAQTSDNQDIYAALDNFNKSLVDQWLDYCSCELETLALSVQLFTSGREVDLEAVIGDAEKALQGLNKGLNKKKYLVNEKLTIADLAMAATVAPLITNLFNQLQRKRFTHIVNWFQRIGKQSKQIEPKKLPAKSNAKVEKWKNKGKKDDKNDKKNEKKNDKSDKGQKDKKKGQKKQETKQQPEKKKQTGDDLFDDDDDTPPSKAAAPKPKKQPKKKPAAKSIVVFDVKVYEEDQDLLALFQKIKTTIVMDGLVWNEQPKIETVAYTMKKLQIGCVVEDEKVSVQEDIFQKIREWEDEIQSVDTVSFQKL